MATLIRLISTDFDGTLFAEFETPPVPASLQELLADLQTRGTRWVINTGRDLTSLMEALGRAHLEVRPDYLVVVEREIYRHTDGRYVPDERWNRRCHDDHAQLFARIQPEIPRLTRWITHHHPADVYADPWSPLCFIARTLPDAEAIERYLLEFCRTVPDLTLVRNDVYARFSHRLYSKGTALAEISRQLGVTRDHVFAAGDHLNDLPMLSRDVAALLAAPANAVPAVQEAVRNQGGFISQHGQGRGVEAALRFHLDRRFPV